MRPSRLDGLAIGLMTILCLSWGIQQVVIKLTAAFVSPLLQAGLRSAGAAWLVLLWMAWRRIPLWRRDGSLWPGLAAGLLFGTEFGLLFHGLTLTTASRAAIRSSAVRTFSSYALSSGVTYRSALASVWRRS